MSTHSHSSCAACKCLRRKCTPECVFAPHFPPDNPEKFTYVHKVFGASNVGKILRDLPPSQRELAANSLAYEGQARMQDPIYGCVAHISFLHQNLNYVQRQLYEAKKELSTYIGPATLGPFFFAHGPPASNSPYAVPVMGLGIGAHNAAPAAAHQYAQTFIHEPPPPPPPPPPESMEAQQIGMAMATADMTTRYDQQQELARFNGQRGFEQMEFLPAAAQEEFQSDFVQQQQQYYTEPQQPAGRS
ncbi:LOB domain-containing protein 6-like [Curcuma longa]|uniref:LOB domain-containing protein 6-like n=1 Tax=Curcuma longa TaxID=136217 RepID=UPI003D9E7231